MIVDLIARRNVKSHLSALQARAGAADGWAYLFVPCMVVGHQEMAFVALRVYSHEGCRDSYGPGAVAKGGISRCLRGAHRLAGQAWLLQADQRFSNLDAADCANQQRPIFANYPPPPPPPLPWHLRPALPSAHPQLHSHAALVIDTARF